MLFGISMHHATTSVNVSYHTCTSTSTLPDGDSAWDLSTPSLSEPLWNQLITPETISSVSVRIWVLTLPNQAQQFLFSIFFMDNILV